MPKITDIKQQVKRADRYSIYIDEKYAFSLGETELLNSGLRIGTELTKAELDKLQDTAKLDKAYDRALNLVAMRQRSEWEIRSYLKRKDYEPEVIDKIVGRLQASNFLNDEKFAKAWVDNRRLLKSISKRRLVQELRQKRVANEVIDKVLSEDEADEREVLRELVERKRKRYPDTLKLMQYLARQGYNYDDIKQVLHDVED